MCTAAFCAAQVEIAIELALLREKRVSSACHPQTPSLVSTTVSGRLLPHDQIRVDPFHPRTHDVIQVAWPTNNGKHDKPAGWQSQVWGGSDALWSGS